MKLLFSFLSFCGLFVLYQCSQAAAERSGVPELTPHFFQHRAEFQQLTTLACAVQKQMNTRHEVYKPGTAPEYPMPLAADFAKIDRLIRQIGGGSLILLQGADGGCSLLLLQWGFVFAGDSVEMSYSYNPSRLADYIPELHDLDKHNPQEPVYFTKPLADGWYVQYDYSP
ncbi:hypothetical protein [Rheinheimera sp.]|uniref:hypothetical protein n=1 Tax=Rheinheimera sp. TaxID=1869214 RepID=UPI003AF43DF8